MELDVASNMADCEVKFGETEISFFWYDEYVPVIFTLRDQIKFIIKLNEFSFIIPIDTNPISFEILSKKNARTCMKLSNGIKFFFNTERLGRDAPSNYSPRHKYTEYYKSRYKIVQFGLIFKNIIHLITFLGIGEDNPINERYFRAVFDYVEEEPLRRVNSF